MEQKIKAIIVDDEFFCREQVKYQLKKYFPQVIVVAEANNGKEAIQLIHFHKPDLIFLDIEIPLLNGFEVLEKLEEPDFEIIFVTAFDRYAIKAIKFSALDYLLKPINREEFKLAVEKFLEKQKQNYDKKSLIKNLIHNIKVKENNGFRLAINTSGSTHFFKPEEIVRCEADINYTRIFKTNKEQFYTAKTLKEFDEILSDHNFIRIHRSHLVNIKFITALTHDHKIILEDNTILEISRRKISEVKSMF